MTLTRYGRFEWGLATAVAVPLLLVSLLLKAPCAAGLVLVPWLAILAFFRHPRRVVPTTPGLFVAPADGVVDDITLLEDTPENRLLEAPRVWRVGIFLSVLDVHVNRAPCAMTVIDKHRRDGGYLDARRPESSSRNVAATLVCRASDAYGGLRLAVRQITGLIARRIVCPPEPGDTFERGEPYGMIKFGSRTELYLPDCAAVTITATPGLKARAGLTVVATCDGADDGAANDVPPTAPPTTPSAAPAAPGTP